MFRNRSEKLQHLAQPELPSNEDRDGFLYLNRATLNPDTDISKERAKVLQRIDAAVDERLLGHSRRGYEMVRIAKLKLKDAHISDANLEVQICVESAAHFIGQNNLQAAWDEVWTSLYRMRGGAKIDPYLRGAVHALEAVCLYGMQPEHDYAYKAIERSMDALSEVTKAHSRFNKYKPLIFMCHAECHEATDIKGYLEKMHEARTVAQDVFADNPVGIASIDLTLAETYLELGLPTQALRYYALAMEGRGPRDAEEAIQHVDNTYLDYAIRIGQAEALFDNGESGWCKKKILEASLVMEQISEISQIEIRDFVSKAVQHFANSDSILHLVDCVDNAEQAHFRLFGDELQISPKELRIIAFAQGMVGEHAKSGISYTKAIDVLLQDAVIDRHLLRELREGCFQSAVQSGDKESAYSAAKLGLQEAQDNFPVQEFPEFHILSHQHLAVSSFLTSRFRLALKHIKEVEVMLLLEENTNPKLEWYNMNLKGTLALETGHYKEAESYFRRTAQILDEVNAADDFDQHHILMGLVESLYQMGEYAECREELHKLGEYTQQFGNLEDAKGAFNLGNSLKLLYFERAYRGLLILSDPECENAALLVAEKLIERASTGYRKHYGCNDTHTALAHTWKGHLYFKSGKWTSALDEYIAAEKIYNINHSQCQDRANLNRQIVRVHEKIAELVHQKEADKEISRKFIETAARIEEKNKKLKFLG